MDRSGDELGGGPHTCWHVARTTQYAQYDHAIAESRRRWREKRMVLEGNAPCQQGAD
jgi:hypothetical protein